VDAAKAQGMPTSPSKVSTIVVVEAAHACRSFKVPCCKHSSTHCRTGCGG
jgi:hypothetical protein